MRITRQNDQLTIALDFFDGRLLHRILLALIDNYRIKPDQIDPKAAQVWYCTRGCISAKMSVDETREWLENIHQFKTARLRLIEHCVAQLATVKDEGYRLQLKVEQAPDFITALNDYRLLAAARNDIGQTEIDMAFLLAFEKLKPAQCVALFEIDFLGDFVAGIIRAIAPEAADWMKE